MLMWLPPSEGKNSPVSGAPLAVDSLAFPALAASRHEVMGALSALGDGEEAARALGVGARAQAQLAANTALLTSPTAPAHRVYSGVLFEALTALFPQAWESPAAENVTIFSGLFGAVAARDHIPDHRLAMGTSLPPLGVLSSYWAPRLDEALAAEARDRIVLDARSGPYRAACKAPWAHVWELRVEREENGQRTVISHDAKRWRGALTGALMSSGWDAESEEAALTAIREAAHTITLRDAKGGTHLVSDVELSEARTSAAQGRHRRLTLVTT